MNALFKTIPEPQVDRFGDVDKGHGRIEQRDVAVVREVDWLGGDRRFPGELRLPDVAAIIRVETRTQLKDRSRFETRYFVTSSKASAEVLANAIRAHWLIENQLHWTLDVTFNEDQSRLRKGHGAKNMAVVRHFAMNLLRQAHEDLRPKKTGLRRKTNKPPAKRQTSIKTKRKLASWSTDYLQAVLTAKAR